MMQLQQLQITSNLAIEFSVQHQHNHRCRRNRLNTPRRRISTVLMNSRNLFLAMIISLASAAARVAASSSKAFVVSSCGNSASSPRHMLPRTCAFVSNGQLNRKLQLDHKHASIQRLPSTRTYAYKSKMEEAESPDAFSLSGYQRPKVNWYPGHIAKAERQLSETLKSVDVVIEVRDARAPKATAHPSVGKWTAGRPRVVVLTRVDTVTTKSRESWKDAYEKLGADRWDETLGGEERNKNMQLRKERRKYDKEDNGGGGNNDGGVEEVLFVDAKRGQGTHAISRAVYRAGRHVNERRNRRGLNDRPLRVGIIGFPNIGKVSTRCACNVSFISSIFSLCNFYQINPQKSLL